MLELTSLKKAYKFQLVIAIWSISLGLAACSGQDKTANVINKGDNSGNNGGYKPSPETGYGTTGYGHIWVLATSEISRYVDIAVRGEDSTRIGCGDITTERQNNLVIYRIDGGACRNLRIDETITTESDNNGLKSIKVDRLRYRISNDRQNAMEVTTVTMAMNLTRQQDGALLGNFEFDISWLSTQGQRQNTLDVSGMTIPVEVRVSGTEFTLNAGNFNVISVDERNNREYSRSQVTVSPEQLAQVDARCGHLHGVVTVNQEVTRSDRTLNAFFKLRFIENRFSVVGTNTVFPLQCNALIRRETELRSIVEGIRGTRGRTQPAAPINAGRAAQVEDRGLDESESLGSDEI